MKLQRIVGLFVLVLLAFFATFAWAQEPATVPVVGVAPDALTDSLAALLRHGGFPAIIAGLGAWVLRSVDKWLDRIGNIAKELIDGFNVKVTLVCPAQETGRCPLAPAASNVEPQEPQPGD